MTIKYFIELIKCTYTHNYDISFPIRTEIITRKGYTESWINNTLIKKLKIR